MNALTVICFILLPLGLAASRPADAQQPVSQAAAPVISQIAFQRPPAPNYADPADWACRPGQEGPCTAGLDAVALGADGSRVLQPFKPAANPPIDCFYVYPTASREMQDYADLSASPAIMKTIQVQAGRLASRCRLFVPLYRQATLFHLRHPGRDKWDGPYQDIQAAWNFYLSHDNHGRGVVLMGHSQGTIILQHLIADKIDGTAAQAHLVAAFLIGNPGLQVPPGKTVGGTFKHIPVCTAAGDTGCVFSWASYLTGDEARRSFGLNKDGLSAACSSPAALGGTGTIDAYFASKDFPAADGTPFVALRGQISAACVADDQGSVLRVTVLPGANRGAITAKLEHDQIKGKRRDWGLHLDDVALSEGSILQAIDAETARWQGQTR